MQPTGTILDTETVELNRYAHATVKRMYGVRVIEDTIVERITYLSDGLKVKGYVTRPKEPGVYPMLIWNRGGFGDRGALDDLTAYLILASAAVWGYVVLATQYRGNKGGEGTEDFGGDDVNDAFAMLEVAKNIPECDLSRVAVEGASRGGMTTYQLLTRYDKFRCAIVHAGLTDLAARCAANEDFRKFMRQKLSHLTEDQLQAEVRRRSAINLVAQFPKTTPVLLFHGTADKRVPIEQSQRMANELKKHDIPYEFVILEGAGHVALKDGSYKQIDLHRKAWLERYLQS
ncbi:MAG: prolyl oligopeptidase family serine peptidase [Candidatus Zixiibacteriota bacterium]